MRRALSSALVLALLAAPASAAAQGEAAGKGAAAAGKLDAKAWVVIDARDRAALSAKAADKRLPIASATKLMTAYVALQRLKPKQLLRAPGYQATDAESLLGLRAGEKMSVRDLIYALVLESANDAAETLAVGVAGSEAAFVAQMNSAAGALGLTNTHYSTPVGLDEPRNYSSARDLVALADELLDNKLFAKAADTPSATLRTGDRPRAIQTRNLLLNQAAFVTGVKTGHTIDAGYVLVGAGEKSGTTLISAVLGTPSEAARDADTLALLRSGFKQYEPSTPVSEGEAVAEAKLEYRDEELPLLAARTLEVSARQGEAVETVIDAPREIDRPVERGERLGQVAVTVGGRPAGNVPLLAERSVEAATAIQKASSIVLNPLALVPLGLIVIGAGLLLARRGGGPKPPRPPRVRSKRTKPRKPRDGGASGTDGPRSREERERMREERMRRRNAKQPDRIEGPPK